MPCVIWPAQSSLPFFELFAIPGFERHVYPTSGVLKGGRPHMLKLQRPFEEHGYKTAYIKSDNPLPLSGRGFFSPISSYLYTHLQAQDY